MIFFNPDTDVKLGRCIVETLVQVEFKDALVLLLLLLLLQVSWIRVLPSHSCGGTLQKSRYKTVAQLNADVCWPSEWTAPRQPYECSVSTQGHTDLYRVGADSRRMASSYFYYTCVAIAQRRSYVLSSVCFWRCLCLLVCQPDNSWTAWCIIMKFRRQQQLRWVRKRLHTDVLRRVAGDSTYLTF